MTFLLFFMALSLAGMFDLGLTLTSAGGGLAHKSGYAGSFFTGVLATVVATPGTARLMGAAIGFALSQNATVTFAVFTALALGLSLPYTALTLVPGWARWLPRPGRWMETLKQLTSIPLFLTVVWLIWVYGHLSGGAQGDSSDHIARLRRRGRYSSCSSVCTLKSIAFRSASLAAFLECRARRSSKSGESCLCRFHRGMVPFLSGE